MRARGRYFYGMSDEEQDFVTVNNFPLNMTTVIYFTEV